jgi:hypothetical protein
MHSMFTNYSYHLPGLRVKAVYFLWGNLRWFLHLLHSWWKKFVNRSFNSQTLNNQPNRHVLSRNLGNFRWFGLLCYHTQEKQVKDGNSCGCCWANAENYSSATHVEQLKTWSEDFTDSRRRRSHYLWINGN